MVKVQKFIQWRIEYIGIDYIIYYTYIPIWCRAFPRFSERDADIFNRRCYGTLPFAPIVVFSTVISSYLLWHRYFFLVNVQFCLWPSDKKKVLFNLKAMCLMSYKFIIFIRILNLKAIYLTQVLLFIIFFLLKY